MAKKSTPSAKQIKEFESIYGKKYLAQSALGLSQYHYYKFKAGELHPSIQSDVYIKMNAIIGRNNVLQS